MGCKASKENACDGKIAYDTLKEANVAAVALIKNFSVKKQIDGYKCQFCGKYHVGNQRHKKKRKEGWREKREKPFDPENIKPKPGRDKGFYLIRTNLQK